MEPHASKSTRVKPAGSLVVVMKDASFARASPASKCVSPFCVGKPTRSTCARWYGKKTYRPSDNANALAALIFIQFVISLAQVWVASTRLRLAKKADSEPAKAETEGSFEGEVASKEPSAEEPTSEKSSGCVAS